MLTRIISPPEMSFGEKVSGVVLYIREQRHLLMLCALLYYHFGKFKLVDGPWTASRHAS